MKNYYRVEKLLCHISEEYVYSHNYTCKVRPINRDVVIVNVYGVLKKEIRDVSVDMYNFFPQFTI